MFEIIYSDANGNSQLGQLHTTKVQISFIWWLNDSVLLEEILYLTDTVPVRSQKPKLALKWSEWVGEIYILQTA